MKSRLIILVVLASLTSCSYLTERGRQEYSYRKYVRKSSVVRAKHQKKFRFRTPEMAIRSDAPIMTTEPESPQSVTTSPSSEEPPPSPQPSPQN